MRPAAQLVELGAQDIQASADSREVRIDEVGVEGVSYPVVVAGSDGRVQHTVADCRMVVDLDHDVRGTHMSRFIEALDEYASQLNPTSLSKLAEEVRQRLSSDRSRVSLDFPYFLRREAPVSGLSAMVRYEGRVDASAKGDGVELAIGVRVPITSLCPCSKEISDYGAHNQRGYVDIEVKSPWSEGEASGIWIDDLVETAEDAGSAQIYSLLKRSDEREVTMRAFDNPAFVEDIVRNVVVALRADVRVGEGVVTATNHESIHAHSAVAKVHWRRGNA